MPITGPCESSVLLAHSLGSKYSIITLEDVHATWIHGTLTEYGLTAKLGSVRGMGVTAEDAIMLYSEPKKLVDAFLRVSKTVIEEDRAEVIIPGCTLISSILTAENKSEIDGAPIIDGLGTAIKMAENLVELREKCDYGVCRNGLYGREEGAPLSVPLNYGFVTKAT